MNSPSLSPQFSVPLRSRSYSSLFSIYINIYICAVNNICCGHKKQIPTTVLTNACIFIRCESGTGQRRRSVSTERPSPQQTTLTPPCCPPPSSHPSSVRLACTELHRRGTGSMEGSSIIWCTASRSLSRWGFGGSSAHMRRRHLKNICHSDK